LSDIIAFTLAIRQAQPIAATVGEYYNSTETLGQSYATSLPIANLILRNSKTLSAQSLNRKHFNIRFTHHTNIYTLNNTSVNPIFFSFK